LDQIRLKRKLYRTHFLDGDETQKAYYKIFSNNFTKIKHLHKSLIIKNNFKLINMICVKLDNLLTLHYQLKNLKLAAKLTVSKTVVRGS